MAGTTIGMVLGTALGIGMGLALAYPAYRQAVIEAYPSGKFPGVEFLWVGFVAGGLCGLVLGGSAGAAAGGVRPNRVVAWLTVLATAIWVLALLRGAIAEIAPWSPYLTVPAVAAVGMTAWWVAGSIARRRARRRGGS